MKASNLWAVAAIAAVAVVGLLVFVGYEKKDGAGIESQIENWVKNNPEAIMKSLTDFQRKQHEMNQPQPEMVSEYKEQLFSTPSSPVAGNPNGKIEIAYFFDFNCGHCKVQSDTIKKVLAARNDVKVVYKNFPVLGPSSELAAQAALAAHQQSKFLEFYEAVYKNRDRSKEALTAIAKEIGLNVAQWEKDLESEAVQNEIRGTREVAQNMRIGGTPFLAIAPDKVFPGRIDELASVLESL